MDKEKVVRLHSSFEEMVREFPDSGVEYWCARDLQMLLGYAQWKNFAKVVDKAITACENSGHEPKDHFAGISKMVDLGSKAKREIEDIALTRYACYLIAQNGDPAKEQVAFAQTYFAVQTRKQEVVERRLAEAERVSARRKLTRQSFGEFRSFGDNGDPAKEQVAFAQTYFAVQTRKQEVVERRLAEAERVSARRKLTRQSFGEFRSFGDSPSCQCKWQSRPGSADSGETPLPLLNHSAAHTPPMEGPGVYPGTP